VLVVLATSVIYNFVRSNDIYNSKKFTFLGDMVIPLMNRCWWALSPWRQSTLFATWSRSGHRHVDGHTYK